MIFNEIKTEYDFYTLIVYDKKIPLVYRIRQYQKIHNQNKEYIDNLKKQGVKIKHYRTMDTDGNVTVVYYKLYALKLFPFKLRIELIKKILKIKNPINITLLDEIVEKWENRNYCKTTTIELMDKEAIILDTLATFFIGGFEGNNILNQKTWEKIKKYESCYVNIFGTEREVNFAEQVISPIYKKNVHEQSVNKLNRDNKKKQLKKQFKKWQKSKTYKLNKLLSFNNHKKDIVIWNWIKNNWQNLDIKYNIEKEGLIDSEKPYLAKWCLVDINNEFIFKDKKYKISDKVEAYKYDENIVNNATEKCNYYSMDKILLIEQFNQLYYFDNNINMINPKYIIVLE